MVPHHSWIPGSDFYQGTPALTVNQYGKGYAYYICTDAEELFYHDFYAKILAETSYSFYSKYNS